MGKFKVGDRVRCLKTTFGFTSGKEYTVRGFEGHFVLVEVDDNGSTTNGWLPEYFELAASPATPIRTITRREIVPGTYGDVTIEAIPFAGREVTYKRLANAASLREAARTFNEIADALDEQKESE